MRTRDEVRGTALFEARLKAKTGYSSYRELAERESHFKPDDLPSHFGSAGLKIEHVTILELKETVQPRVTQTFNKFQPSENQIFDALYTPPLNECLRVIIWHFMDGAIYSLGVFNTIGLILGIDPRFLGAVVALEWLRVGSSGQLSKVSPLTAAHAVLGESVVTFGRYDVSKGVSVPFVLIAGSTEIDCLDFIQAETRKHSIPGRSQFSDMLQFPVGTDPREDVDYHKWLLSDTWLTLYLDTLGVYLARRDRVSAAKHNLSLAALFPIVQMQILRMRKMAGSLLALLRKEKMSELYSERTKVRRYIEDTEEAIEHLSHYISLHHLPDWLEDPIYQEIQLECREVITQLRRLETEVRDFMQIQSGALAIEETKKSIEVANIQIEEGRRVKTFTVLAFIYVPLNLATSIYGMNLQPLNETGQPLHAFVLTAVLALVITGASWFCVEQMNSYLIWRRRDTEEEYDHKPDYRIAVRLAMVFWLVTNRRTSWMLKSNAWYAILTNSERVGTSADTPQQLEPAGHFISRYCLRSYRRRPQGTIGIFNVFYGSHRW